MREMHLFAGAGGGILGGMLLGHTPVCAVEIDPYCRQVLKERQDDGSLPAFPIYEDVRSFDGKPWRGKVDVICGGFPCQPFSCAGKQLGVDDPRHLWPEMARIIEEVRQPNGPRPLVFAENVSLAAFEEPWRDLRRMGFRVPPALCLSAADVGAPHLRKRWWLLATDANGTAVRDDEQRQAFRRHDVQASRQAESDDNGTQGIVGNANAGNDSGLLQEGELQSESGRSRGAHWKRTAAASPRVANAEGQPKRAGLCESESQGVRGRRSSDSSGSDTEVPNTNSERLEERQSISSNTREKLATIERSDWWAVEPDVGRLAHGVAFRVDRLRALGNGQVPQCAAQAWRILMEEANRA